MNAPMNNLFISHNLTSPGDKYDNVVEAIKSVGHWAKVHPSLYYVSTKLSEGLVLATVKAAANTDDKIIVISATSVQWVNLPKNVNQYILDNWNNN